MFLFLYVIIQEMWFCIRNLLLITLGLQSGDHFGVLVDGGQICKCAGLVGVVRATCANPGDLRHGLVVRSCAVRRAGGESVACVLCIFWSSVGWLAVSRIKFLNLHCVVLFCWFLIFYPLQALRPRCDWTRNWPRFLQQLVCRLPAWRFCLGSFCRSDNRWSSDPYVDITAWHILSPQAADNLCTHAPWGRNRTNTWFLMIICEFGII